MTDKVNKTIWFEPVKVELLNKHVVPNNMMETMEMEFTDVGDDYLIVKMPVKPQSHQPLGMLHGGASVALAESVGSAAANMVIDRNKQYAVGQSINANHIRAKNARRAQGYYSEYSRRPTKHSVSTSNRG